MLVISVDMFGLLLTYIVGSNNSSNPAAEESVLYNNINILFSHKYAWIGTWNDVAY